MAHYAVIDEDNVVISVFPGRNEEEIVDGVSDWESHYSEVLGKKVLRTSYNTFGGVHYNQETYEPSTDQSKAFRFNYAGIDYTYDEQLDAFIPPKPEGSWILDEETCLWVAPEKPNDGLNYKWDGLIGEWVVTDS